MMGAMPALPWPRLGNVPTRSEVPRISSSVQADCCLGQDAVCLLAKGQRLIDREPSEHFTQRNASTEHQGRRAFSCRPSKGETIKENVRRFNGSCFAGTCETIFPHLFVCVCVWCQAKTLKQSGGRTNTHLASEVPMSCPLSIQAIGSVREARCKGGLGSHKFGHRCCGCAGQSCADAQLGEHARRPKVFFATRWHRIIALLELNAAGAAPTVSTSSAPSNAALTAPELRLH